MKQAAPDVFIESSAFRALAGFFKQKTFSSCFLLVDENTAKHCYPVLLKFIPPHQVIQIQAGEEHKTIQTCETIWSRLTESNADRNALIINLGGGVIGDLGGFAAGCYKRGIQFINVPTTLLAMVDANVGAKTGVDFMDFKNQIGLFIEPAGVFVFTGFLNTLPDRHLKSGLAEVIKHYLIADKDGFEALEGLGPDWEKTDWDKVVETNIRIKSGIVTQDPKEQNIRKALNFGHTVGHAIESLFLKDENQTLLHGEAVAAGMLAESYISTQAKLLTNQELTSIRRTILQIYDLPEISPKDYAHLCKLMKQDKKNNSGEIRFTLLNGIGNYSIHQSVKEDIIMEALAYYNEVLHEHSEGKSSH